MTTTTIRSARPEDLPYLLWVTNRLNDELGFIPRIAFERRIAGTASGGILLAEENGSPAGLLHYGSLRGVIARIFQAGIQYDAQRRHHGLALLRSYESKAIEHGARLISLTCRIGLDANAFWKAAGYRQIETVPGMRAERLHWIKALHPDPPPAPSRVHPCKICGKKTSITVGPLGQQLWTCRECSKNRRENSYPQLDLFLKRPHVLLAGL